MLKVNFQGRTGNVLLQNIGLSILSKKFDMKALYARIPEVETLGLRLNQSQRVCEDFINVGDRELTELLEKETLDRGIIYDGTFQVKYFVQNFREEILGHFDLKYLKTSGVNGVKNDVFVHVRLDDVTHMNPGYDYYERCLLSLPNFEKGYVASDSYHHPIVQNLISKFGLKFVNGSPISLINFAKNFNNLILSKGSFSWWMGMLSRGENIFYPTGDVPWYGDIYVFDDWRGITIVP